jgi:phosphoglucosamine mutase
MRKYPQILINLKIAKKVNPDSHEGLQKAIKSVEKQLGENGRVLLRASGTEPLIRVMVEGEHEDVVRNFAEQLTEAVKSAIGT